MENLFHLRDLRYLNLALNNISKVEGLENCEFLEKLDLTLNFVGYDALSESVEHLTKLRDLQELFLSGNPCCGAANGSKSGKFNDKGANWNGYRPYVVARLPQLRYLDGVEITRSARIEAMRALPALVAELADLAADASEARRQKENDCVDLSAVRLISDDELTDHSPDVRSAIYREMSEEKDSKEAAARRNMPRKRGEEDLALEQASTLETVRKMERDRYTSVAVECEIRQCNMGRWEYVFDEESKPGYLLLEISVQRHLSTSLIDVDVHPHYVSIVIKSKILRLKLPMEVQSSNTIVQRVTSTGKLIVIMPRVHLGGEMESVVPFMSRNEKEQSKQIYVRKTALRKMERTIGLSSKLYFEAGVPVTASSRMEIEGLVEKMGWNENTAYVGLKEASNEREVPFSTVNNSDNDSEDGCPPSL